MNKIWRKRENSKLTWQL